MPLKVKIVVWRISHGRLPMQDRLSSFMPDISSMCCLCGDEENQWIISLLFAPFPRGYGRGFARMTNVNIPLRSEVRCILREWGRNQLYKQDKKLLLREWPNVLSLLAGLIFIKTLIITALGPRVGLTLQESVRIGLLLSQGGEFGFVVFSLANRLGVLPLELNKLLIIVVVLSMALTPLLNEFGRRAAEIIDVKLQRKEKDADAMNYDVREPVVIVGFGQMGQVLANFLGTPLASGLDGNAMGWPYVAFDLNPGVVKAARKLGFPVLYGDGSRPAVLQSAGISSPKAVMIMYTGKERTSEAVQRIRLAFPAVPIYARAQDLAHLLELKKAGATDALLENAETSLQLGGKLLKGLGVMSDDVTFLSQIVRDSMELQAQEVQDRGDNRGPDVMKPLQVRVTDMVEAQAVNGSFARSDQITSTNLGVSGYVEPAQDEQSIANESQHEVSTFQSEAEEDEKGVIYCDLNINDSLQSNEGIDAETDTVDPSIPSITSKDGF